MTTLIVMSAVMVGLIVFEGIAYLVYTKKAPEWRKNVLEFLLYGRAQPFSAAGQIQSQSIVSRYAEHPFTAWSLNPEFLNVFEEKIHNRQGFRTAKNFEETDPAAIRIYCAGGSSTYCTDIERNEETWPERLGQYLSTATCNKVEVINGGVGSFNTFQSYIRLSAYIDHLRPDVVIVYHAKNDLNSYYHDTSDDRNVLPDYSNSIRSLNLRGIANAIHPAARFSYLGKLWAAWKLQPNQLTLGQAFTNPVERDIATYLSARVDYSIIETMQSNMASLCRGRGVPLFYLTQRVEDPVYSRYIQEINSRIRLLENSEAGCFVFDLDGALPHDPGLLTDKMHYSQWGCEKVAEHVGQFLMASGIMPQLRPGVDTS